MVVASIVGVFVALFTTVVFTIHTVLVIMIVTLQNYTLGMVMMIMSIVMMPIIRTFLLHYFSTLPLL